MGSYISIVNDTEDVYYCQVGPDTEAMATSKWIIETITSIAEQTLPGGKTFGAAITSVTKSSLQVIGLTPSVVSAIMTFYQKALKVGPAVAKYIVDFEVKRITSQGFVEILPGKNHLWPMTLSLWQQGHCKRIRKVVKYDTNRIYLLHDEVFMRPIFSASQAGAANDHKIGFWITKPGSGFQNYNEVEIMPPVGYSSWKNVAFAQADFDANFRDDRSDMTLQCSRPQDGGHPFQSCANILAAFCSKIHGSLFTTHCACADRVKQASNTVNVLWSNFLKSCFADLGGMYPSKACTSAFNQLKVNNEYLVRDAYGNSKWPVTDEMFESLAQLFVSPGCWGDYLCRSEGGIPFEDCVLGLQSECLNKNQYSNHDDCECKRKILAARDQLNPEWQTWIHKCVDDPTGSNCKSYGTNYMKGKSYLVSNSTSSYQSTMCLAGVPNYALKPIDDNFIKVASDVFGSGALCKF